MGDFTFSFKKSFAPVAFNMNFGSFEHVKFTNEILIVQGGSKAVKNYAHGRNLLFPPSKR